MAPGMFRGRPQPSQGAHTPEVRLRRLDSSVKPGTSRASLFADACQRTETRDGDEAWTPKIVRRIRCSDISGQLLEGLAT